ncbi:MAG: DeoR/GlpR transcriptional regulator, partial [bacterium]|nr:DeoR/GlpR transcriptional regulator [bacterium]
VSISDHLAHLSSVTGSTYSVQVINRAMSYPNIRLISLPGSLKRDTASLVGSSCTDFLKDFNIRRAFMACTGISAEYGVCNASTEEYNIKKTALARSQKHYLLADSSKFGKTSLMTYGEISQFQYLLTDAMPDHPLHFACKEQGCRIQIAKDT